MYVYIYIHTCVRMYIYSCHGWGTHLPDLHEAGGITAGDVRVKLTGRSETKSGVLNSQASLVFTMVSHY